MTPIFNLKGKTALIAGAGGLGRGAAVGLAATGTDIVFADIDPTHCAAGTKDVSEFDVDTHEITFDIFDLKQIDAMIDQAIAFKGRLDILVNAVGISRMGLAEEMSYDDWMTVQNGFLNNVFYLCQQVAIKTMIPNKAGKIINVASMSGVVVTGDMSAPYCTAKAGVIHMTHALASNWAKYGINVNCISPGYMLTPLTEGFLSDQEMAAGLLANIPKARFGKPKDMAGLAVYLSSDASDYMTGQNLIIDGGYTLR